MAWISLPAQHAAGPVSLNPLITVHKQKGTAMKQLVSIFLAAVFVATLSACSPEVGSEKWCANMKEKPKGDWSANEASDYAKHCVFK